MQFKINLKKEHKIKKVVIRFKSRREVFYKEQKGLKCNTVRFINDWKPDRWRCYSKATHVRIAMKENPKMYFIREISDKTQYLDIVIISWRDEE